MLEVLDPEQNNQFSDHYLEVPYDLSNVLFIATANELYPLPEALEDRMEIIDISGYTMEEKVEIAKKHLLPKQLREHGLDTSHLKLGKKEFEQVVEGYTSEWGEIGGAGASTFTRKEFTGDGSETDFTLDSTPSDENDLMVFIEGVYQNKNSYTF